MKDVMDVVSLEVFREAKEFKEGALDKVFPGQFSMAKTYDLFKSQAEANRRLEEAEKQKKPAVEITTGS